MMEFAWRNVKFLPLVDPDITWIRETMDSLREPLAGMSSTCPFDQRHDIQNARIQPGAPELALRQGFRGKENLLAPPVSACLPSPDNGAKKELAFHKDLIELKAQMEDGVT